MSVVAGLKLVLAAAGLLIGACGTQPATRMSIWTGEETIEIAALKTVYALEGDGRAALFVDVTDASDAEIDYIIDRLREDLDVIVRHVDEASRDDPDLPALTPYDPKTGEVGVVLRLVNVTVTDPQTRRADVTYARSGLDGGSLVVTLIRHSSGWIVGDAVPTSGAKLLD